MLFGSSGICGFIVWNQRFGCNSIGRDCNGFAAESFNELQITLDDPGQFLFVMVGDAVEP
jgi:hypothetical protein